MVNAVQIQTNISEVNGINNTLQNSIQAYFNEQTPNTLINYKGWFEDFFQFVFNKSLLYITWEDISNRDFINITMIKNYRNYLKEKKKNSNNTINNKISAIKNFFIALNNCDIVSLNLSAFGIKRFKEVKGENSYGALKESEINDLYTYAKQETNNPMVKYLLFKTLYITAYRIEAVRQLQWKDLIQKYDMESEKEVWVIKGKNGDTKHNFAKSISDSFYEELIQLKGNKSSSSYIFAPAHNNVPISAITIRKVFDNFCKEYGLDKDGRNLALHSIKHASASKAYKLTNGNVKLTQYQANHMHVQTTLDIYVDNEIPLTEQVSYMMDNQINRNTLDDLSKDQLLDLINSVSDGIYLDLVKKAKERKYVSENVI